jgi:hypothetical protein
MADMAPTQKVLCSLMLCIMMALAASVWAVCRVIGNQEGAATGARIGLIMLATLVVLCFIKTKNKDGESILGATFRV